MSDDWLSGSLFGLDTGLQVHSAQAANKTNVKIMRENNAFLERMSNTAIRRRADDFEAAGFNRLLAATGPGASTPSPQGVTVEAEYKGGAVASAAQLANIIANTQLTTQEARIKRVEANNAELFGEQNAMTARGTLIETELGKKLENDLKEIEAEMSKEQLARLRETWPVLLQTAKQQQRAGQLDLEALENIAKVGGIEAGKTKDVLKLIIDFLRGK